MKKPPIVSTGLEPFEQRMREGRKAPVRPFRLARKIALQIQMALAKLSDPLRPTDAVEAMSKIDSYASRGHGGRHKTTNRTVTGRQMQDRSKYHPGECFARGCA